MIASDVQTLFNVTAIGDTQKPALIFAHGFGTDQSAWRFVTHTFLPDYRLVLYDNIASSKVNSKFYSPLLYNSLHTYADDLLSICEALSIRDAIMVGHSVSGMVSLLASIKNPSAFSRIICLNPSPRYLNDPATAYIGGFSQADLDTLLSQMKQNYSLWASGFAPMAMNAPLQPELTLHMVQTLQEIRPDIAVSVVQTIFSSDHRADLPLVHTPVSLIFSEEDVVVAPPVRTYMQAHIPDCQLHCIHSHGHLPHISAPAEVIKVIKQILDK